MHQRATASATELQVAVMPASLPANASATFSGGPSYVLNAGVVGNGGLHARVATVAPAATHAASTAAATTQPVSAVAAAAAAAAAAADSRGPHAASAATATNVVPVAGTAATAYPSASADNVRGKAVARKRKQREKQLKAFTAGWHADVHGGDVKDAAKGEGKGKGEDRPWPWWPRSRWEPWPRSRK